MLNSVRLLYLGLRNYVNFSVRAGRTYWSLVRLHNFLIVLFYFFKLQFPLPKIEISLDV